MATYASFLKPTGIDYTLAQNSNRSIGLSPGAFNPDAAFGKVYWVDKNTGDDDHNGLSPQQAFATIEEAITVSNAEVGNYNMNTIYVGAQSYSETLTALPKNCNVVGIGGKVRIAGVSTFAASSQNAHFWNIQFRDTTSAPMVTIPSTSYSIGFHGCTFDNGSGTSTYGISVGGTQDFVLEDCFFCGNPVFPTAIHITGNHIRTRIRRNYISATTNGILIASASVGYQNYIEENIIGRTMTDPNSSAQMAYGINSLKADGHSGFMMINNRIEAVDAIYFAHTTGTNETDACLGNIISQAGTGTSEVDYTG